MKNELRVIKQASFFKRIVALIMDGAVAIFGFFFFFVLVFSPIATKALHYQDYVNQGRKLQEDSHLFVLLEDTDKNYTQINSDQVTEEDPQFYIERVKYYYVTFKTEIAADKDVPITKEDGTQVLPKDYYTVEWANETFKDVDTVEKAKKASYDALVDLTQYFTDINKKIKGCELFMILPSFALNFGIF